MTDDDWRSLYHEVTNTFSPGTPIREKELFSGRLPQILMLLDAVAQAGKHAVIFGEPGVGKTSLANTFALGTSGVAHQVYVIRVNADANDSFSSLWERVFKRIRIEFKENGTDYRQTLAKEYAGAISADDVQLELESMSANAVPIIILDEFNQISDKSITGEIARLIKNISDFSLNCTIVVVGVAEDVSGLIRGHSSIARQLVQVNMPRMNIDELNLLISARVNRLGMKIDGDLLWKMCFVSRGMPYFAHLLGLHTARVAIINRSLVINEEHFGSGIKLGLDEVEQDLKDTYVNGTMSKKEITLFRPVLLACALSECDELGRFQQKDVRQPLAAIIPGKQYKATTYAFHMNEFCYEKRMLILENVGMSEGQNPRYRFRNPLMQPYVILRGIEDGLFDKTILEGFIPPRQPSLPI